MSRYKSFSLPGADHPISLKFKDGDPLFDRLEEKSSSQIRTAAGFATYQDLLTAAEAAGVSPHRLILTRLAKSLGREARPYSGWPAGTKEKLDRLRDLVRDLGAKVVLDPFAGRADYVTAAAQLPNVTPLYCEVSPVYRFIAASRIAALSCTVEARQGIATDLEQLATTFESDVRKASVDSLLERTQKTYLAVAAQKDALDLLMRARTVIDAKPRIEGGIAASAVLEALPRSPGELDRAPLLRDVVRHLNEAAVFVRSEPSCETPPRLVAEDARELALLPPLGVDCVLTNPPSLNFAAYTQPLALWLLGSRRPRQRQFRETSEALASVTSVIGAVRTRSIKNDIRRIAARDDRIARIAANYFADMAGILAAVAARMTKRSTLIFDMQPSELAGNPIDTPGHLVWILGAFGFESDRSVGDFIGLRR
jgi:hypothetical protein